MSERLPNKILLPTLLKAALRSSKIRRDTSLSSALLSRPSVTVNKAVLVVWSSCRLTDKLCEDCFGIDDFAAVRKTHPPPRILDRNGRFERGLFFIVNLFLYILFVYVKSSVLKEPCPCGMLKGVRYNATK